jgi:uncharacterized protein involved in type VI secretion and phage assembly
MESIVFIRGKIRSRVRATVNTDSSGTGISPTVRIRQSAIRPRRSRLGVRSHSRTRWRGTEASHLKVYTKETEIRAVVGQGHESLCCDTGGRIPGMGHRLV